MFVTVGEWLEERLKEKEASEGERLKIDSKYGLARSTIYSLLKSKDYDTKIGYKTYYNLKKHLAKDWNFPSREEVRDYIEDRCKVYSNNNKCETCGTLYGAVFTNPPDKFFYEVHINNHKEKFPAPLRKGITEKNILPDEYHIKCCKRCLDSTIDVLLTPYSSLITQLTDRYKSQLLVSKLASIQTNQGLISRIKNNDIQEQYINLRVALGIHKEALSHSIKRGDRKSEFLPIVKRLKSHGYIEQQFEWHLNEDEKTRDYLKVYGYDARNDLICFTKASKDIYTDLLAASEAGGGYLMLMSSNSATGEQVNSFSCYKLRQTGFNKCKLPYGWRDFFNKILQYCISSTEIPSEPKSPDLYNIFRDMVFSKITEILKNPKRYMENKNKLELIQDFVEDNKNVFTPGKPEIWGPSLVLFQICQGKRKIEEALAL